MKKPSHPSRGVPTAVNCLSTLLKEPMVRSSFVKADGVKLLIPLISPASTQQSIQVILHNLIPNKLHNWFEYKLVHVGPSNRWLGKLFFIDLYLLHMLDFKIPIEDLLIYDWTPMMDSVHPEWLFFPFWTLGEWMIVNQRFSDSPSEKLIDFLNTGIGKVRLKALLLGLEISQILIFSFTASLWNLPLHMAFVLLWACNWILGYFKIPSATYWCHKEFYKRKGKGGLLSLFISSIFFLILWSNTVIIPVGYTMTFCCH